MILLFFFVFCFVFFIVSLSATVQRWSKTVQTSKCSCDYTRG